ncbi:hypothetical protein INS49_010090 [Diaporthe citri]|uniref:uncharacterized protein n=1 Tax=Diaporthe citri TaxID=83186 RepID=UPI001C81EE2A|nr:uncharacterized protein INS49_010090 [Diaporthe citri]KAG6361861.1 hypothetical protein INS49_010090 [Diaporthe citri]
MVSFFGLGKKKKEAQDGPVHSLYAQQWKRDQSPFGPRTPQNNTSSTSLPARPSSSHSSRSPSPGPGGQKSIYANRSATGSMQDLSTNGSKRPGSGKLPRTGSPLRPTSSDGRSKPNLGSARSMSPESLAAAASQAGFRFENPPQKPLGAHPPSTGNSNDNNNNQQPKPPARNPGRRPPPVSIERNRSPLGRYEVRSEADSEVSSPTSQSRSQTTARSNVTSLTSIGSNEMDRQIGQWAVRVSADAGGIDEKVRSPTSPTGPFDLEPRRQAGKDEDDSEENGLKALDTISISEPRQSLMPLSAHDPGAGGDGRGYSMILQYYLDSDARESMVI